MLSKRVAKWYRLMRRRAQRLDQFDLPDIKLRGKTKYAVWSAAALSIIVSGIFVAPNIEEGFRVTEVLAPRVRAYEGALVDFIEPIWIGARKGSPARAAGLHRGKLLSVFGEPLPETGQVAFLHDIFSERVGEELTLTYIPRDSAEAQTVVLNYRPETAYAAESKQAIISIHLANLIARRVYALSALVFLIVGLALLYKLPHSLIAVVTGTAFVLRAMFNTYAQNGETILDNQYTAAVFMVSNILIGYFMASFPTGRVHPRIGIVLPVLAAINGMAIILSDNYVHPVALAAYIALLVIGIAVIRYRYVVHLKGAARQQCKYLVWSGVLAGLGMLAVEPLRFFSSGYSEWSSVIYLITSIGYNFILLFPIGVLIALLKFRLWDAEVVWSRSAAYASLTVILAACAAGGTAAIQAFVKQDMSIGALGISAAITAALFIPLQNKLKKWANKRFLYRLTALREECPALILHLAESESQEVVAAAVVKRVVDAIKALRAAIVIRRGDTWFPIHEEGTQPGEVQAWLEQYDLDQAPSTHSHQHKPTWRDLRWEDTSDELFGTRVALPAEHAAVGSHTEAWLLIGPRPDGSGYGPDDMEAVAVVAPVTGRALRAIRKRLDRQAQDANDRRSLLERLDRLARQLGPNNFPDDLAGATS